MFGVYTSATENGVLFNTLNPLEPNVQFINFVQAVWRLTCDLGLTLLI